MEERRKRRENGGERGNGLERGSGLARKKENEEVDRVGNEWKKKIEKKEKEK